MALSVSQTNVLCKIIKPGMRICSFGYPDILMDAESLLPMFSFDDFNALKFRHDSDAICKRHGLKPHPVPDAESFFKRISCKLDVYDIVQERGCERLLDLNKPRDCCEQYDIVLDVGTIEHCFNIAQAIMNMAVMVKEGGYILHENPFNQGNHGFYNLNPTFYSDFYGANGFDLLECRLVSKDGRSINSHRTERFRFTESEVNVFALARKTAIQSFVWPMQTKYRNLKGKLRYSLLFGRCRRSTET